MPNDSKSLERLIQKVYLIVSYFPVFDFTVRAGDFSTFFLNLNAKNFQQNPTTLTAAYFCKTFLLNRVPILSYKKGCHHNPSETLHQQI